MNSRRTWLTTPEPCTLNATDVFVIMEDLTR
jgi:hypothetical protein